MYSGTNLAEKRLKNHAIAPFKHKKRCKNAFQTQKKIFSKRTDHLGVFCTISKSLTPQTDEIRDGNNIASDQLQIYENLGDFFVHFFVFLNLQYATP